MPVVAFSIPSEWLCSECQEKANGDSIPNQGGQNELLSACGVTHERETPSLDLGQSNVVHQNSSDTRKISSGKVKFISSEEVASLNRDRRPYGSAASYYVRKEDLSMNRNIGHGSSMPTTRSRTDVVAKEKVDSQIEDKTNDEKKIVSADKGKFTCQVQHERREKETFCASATGCESEIKSPSHNKGTLLIMDSSAEYSRRPAPEICWTDRWEELFVGYFHEANRKKESSTSQLNFYINFWLS
ncbi:hypothetical protein QOZ80_3AG0229650 [Eleusine coracana subsp. coracana]|nr:hypothetical protein QOZ80_3AG0229650 [Eleusine coracana subsp. coracana]